MKARQFCCAIVAATAFAAAGARADSPQHFLRDAMHGDNAEIRLGEMAQRRGDSREVQAYGRTLAADHQQALNQVKRFLPRYNIRLDAQMPQDFQRNWDHLSALHGRDYDREFIRIMIDDHRQDIGAFRDEARRDRGPVGKLAAEQLPTLQKHLDMALSIQPHLEDRMAGPGYNGGPDRNNRGWDHRGDHR